MTRIDYSAEKIINPVKEKVVLELLGEAAQTLTELWEELSNPKHIFANPFQDSQDLRAFLEEMTSRREITSYTETELDNEGGRITQQYYQVPDPKSRPDHTV